MTEKIPLTFYPSEEWLKNNGKFGNPESIWAQCSKCNTRFYIGDIGDSVKLMNHNQRGYTNHWMANEEEAAQLAGRWLHEEHEPKCIIHHKPKL